MRGEYEGSWDRSGVVVFFVREQGEGERSVWWWERRLLIKLLTYYLNIFARGEFWFCPPTICLFLPLQKQLTSPLANLVLGWPSLSFKMSTRSLFQDFNSGHWVLGSPWVSLDHFSRNLQESGPFLKYIKWAGVPLGNCPDLDVWLPIQEDFTHTNHTRRKFGFVRAMPGATHKRSPQATDSIALAFTPRVLPKVRCGCDCADFTHSDRGDRNPLVGRSLDGDGTQTQTLHRRTDRHRDRTVLSPDKTQK